ncbi:MAG: nuclease-related domain-containing protein [Anaerolineae bacterium]
MKVYTNQRLIEAKAKIGKFTTLIGLVVLAGGFLFSLRPQYIVAAYAALIVGSVAAQIGTRYVTRWVQQPRADQILTKALKGLDQRHLLYNYILPAEHVLLGPGGLHVFRLRPHEGEINFDGRRWYRPFSWLTLFRDIRRGGLGNPTLEVKQDISKMRDFLSENLPEVEPPIQGAIVFTNPKARLKVVGSEFTVLSPKSLRSYFRKSKPPKTIPSQTHRQLRELFTELAEEVEANT